MIYIAPLHDFYRFDVSISLIFALWIGGISFNFIANLKF